MECRRCGGLWVERGEDSYCIICGNRTMEGHPACGVGEKQSDQERKALRTINHKHQKKPTAPPSTQKSNRGRPTQAKRAEALKAKPSTCPIEEHPYMLDLAAKWEGFEREIEGLKQRQIELKKAASDFVETYPKKYL
jgi:hypothetical protein